MDGAAYSWITVYHASFKRRKHTLVYTYIHTTTTYVRGWLCGSNHVVECHRVFLVFGLCRILQ